MVGYTPLFPPFQPSNLRIPTGPSSPASPLSSPPLAARPPTLSPLSTASSDYPSLPSPAPPSPLPWIWYCHICHKHYPMGATRRCLHDGHTICFFPSEKVSKRTGKVKTRPPCATEFDYGGWRAWNQWRRRNFPSRQTKHKQRTRDCCRKCDYPSQCTNPNHSSPRTPVSEPFLSHSPELAAPPASPVVNDPESPPASTGPCTTFDQLLGSLEPVAPSTSSAAVSKRASRTLDWLFKVAGTRSARVVTLLSPIHEEFHASPPNSKTATETHETTDPVPNAVVSRPRTSPTCTTSGSKQIRRNAVAATKIPSPAAAEDFQSFKARMDRIHGV